MNLAEDTKRLMSVKKKRLKIIGRASSSKKVIPNLNQGNEWDEAFYRHCRRLKVMTHVDNPWLPESERKIVEEEPWKKTKNHQIKFLPLVETVVWQKD